jgi:cytochrome c2
MRRSLIFALIAAAFVLASLLGCDDFRSRGKNFEAAAHLTGGNPEAGRDRIQHYGCRSCHTIPGIPGAEALVGPPLIHWSKRVYIAGELPNTPDNLMRWLQHPPQVEPKTAMPDMGITEQDSRDIAAYLYSLE